MKRKKIFMYLGIIILILIIFYLGYLVYININYNKSEVQEITPEQELSDDNLRKTIITLYFLDKENNSLIPEARQIDAKKLLNDPYKTLLQLLIDGPKNEKLEKLIPENTTINNMELDNGIMYIDFSKEFIENQNLGEEKERLIINSVLKTLVELTEVDGIKILIDGEENLSFPDNGMSFNNIFTAQ